MPWDASKPFCEGLCITMFATGTDFGAASYWVPSGIGPFNLGYAAHMYTIYLIFCVFSLKMQENFLSA
jgi:hypothetical protein